MKACIYIKKSRGRGRGQTLALLKHCAGEGRSTKEIDDGRSRVVAIDAYGLVGNVDAKRMAELRDNLLRQHHGGRSKELAKHVVLSCQDTIDPVARRAAIRVLRRAAYEFLKTFSPGCAALAFSHNDRLHPHVHLIISNSDSNRSLHWQPKLLRKMQSMEWLSRDLQLVVQSGRRKPGKAVHNPYPKAKLTLAQELATMPESELEKIPWAWRGNTRVFLWKKRRIRERTINKERERLKNETISRISEHGEIHERTTNPLDATHPREPSLVGRRNKNSATVAGPTSRLHGVAQATTGGPNFILTGALKKLKGQREQRQPGFEPPAIQ